jgi:hypothetical protein
MLALSSSEVRALIESGQLEAIRVRGRWLISADSIRRLDGAPAAVATPEADLRRLEERVAALERRVDAVESTGGPPRSELRPALQPLFRPSE